MLEVHNLAFTYRIEPVLRDVSFVVSPGEVVSIMGANGAGKTTLLRILALLAMPDSGKVMVDGKDGFSRPLWYRRQIGYLPERISLYDDMNVKEYLNYRARIKGEQDKRIKRRIQESAEICRIVDLMRTPIFRLSAGQKKRVAFADAIMLRPRILLLDDFLSGLDLAMRQDVGQLLSSAAAFSSVIITGHEVCDFAEWTTRFLVLKGGTVSADIENRGLRVEILKERIVNLLEGGGGE